MVSYTLPGMTEFSDINLTFLTFYRDVPDLFLDGVEIASVYGGFAGSRLCGGRNNVGVREGEAAIERLVAKYNDLGVACNATFTNQFADADAIAEDGYSRRILELLDAHSPQVESGSARADANPSANRNGVILFTDDMDAYVRERHPSLARISSTTKELSSVEETNAELSRFDRVVLNYNLTHDEAAVARIDRPEALEVMVNEYCTPNCPFRREHYRDTSKSQLVGAQSSFRCRHEAAPQAYSFMYGLIEGDAFLKNAVVRRYADELGVGSFKIVGRGLARYDIVDAYLYYLIKPESWYEVRDYLIHRGYL